MKISNVRITKILFVLAIAYLTSFASPLNAQIGPLTNSLGIYGSAPTATATPFTCGDVHSARLTIHPDLAAGDDIPVWSYTLPLNGLKNFNFFYTADGLSFLSGGGYKVNYLNAAGTNCYGGGDVVTYSPNSGHTNGVQVRPHNGSLPFRGEHGIVQGYVPNGGGAVVPLENAVVRAFSTFQSPSIQVLAKTNANGYFSIYYKNGNSAQFLPVNPSFGYDRYWFIITGTYNGCSYVWQSEPIFNIWWPENSTNPSASSYFTTGAETDVPVPILTPSC